MSFRSSIVLSLVMTCATASAYENSFPELNFKSEWDRGCQDWPDKLQEGRESNPVFMVEKGTNNFRLMGKLRIERLLGESEESLMSSLDQMLRDFIHYPDWIMPGVNVHPEGGTYFVEVGDLKTRIVGADSFDLVGPFFFRLLWVRKEGRTTIQSRVYNEEPPACPAFPGKKAKLKLLRFRMIPRPDLLDWMIGEIWVVPTQNGAELRARAALRPARPIFELMPQALMESQVRYRGQRVLENLLELRRKKALSK